MRYFGQSLSLQRKEHMTTPISNNYKFSTKATVKKNAGLSETDFALVRPSTILPVQTFDVSAFTNAWLLALAPVQLHLNR